MRRRGGWPPLARSPRRRSLAWRGKLQARTALASRNGARSAAQKPLAMAQRPICSICGKRRAERFCPAKGERICAVCCATEREVRLDCPVDCPYLIAAHRYEQEHRQPLAPSEVPFANVQLSSDLLYKNEAFLSGLGYALLKFSAEHRDLADGDIFTALEALAETYRTLVSGIYYEKPPNAPSGQRALRRSRQFHTGLQETGKLAEGLHCAEGQRHFPLARLSGASLPLEHQRPSARAHLPRTPSRPIPAAGTPASNLANHRSLRQASPSGWRRQPVVATLESEPSARAAAPPPAVFRPQRRDALADFAPIGFRRVAGWYHSRYWRPAREFALQKGRIVARRRHQKSTLAANHCAPASRAAAAPAFRDPPRDR